jgi:V/A-type H+-transporting ATPase subunit C
VPQNSYPYACARISALSKGLFSRTAIHRMAEGSLEDAMRMLLDARYGNMPDATPTDCEHMIDQQRRQTADTIRELSPMSALTDLFLLTTDVHNLKVLIKARLLGQQDVPWQEGGLYSKEVLSACVADQHYAVLPTELADALNDLESRLRIASNPQLVSARLDYGYLAHALRVVREVKEPFAQQYFTALCDFDNVLTFLRMRAMGASKEDLKDVLLPEGGITHDQLMDAYELSADTMARALSGSVARDAMNSGLSAMLTSGNIGLLEKTRDDYLLSLVNQHKNDVLTIFPVVGYYLARDREAQAIRLILTSKRNGLGETVIQERLRELYG